jgi:FtsH-binding integral membrane protein
MDKEQAFKEAVISLGDLGELVEEMRKLGRDQAGQLDTSSITARISTGGIVAGTLLTLFGIFTVLMLYYMRLDAISVSGAGIFIVAGGVLLTFSVLIRETRQKYGMNKIRAALYALSIGLILFSIFSGITSRFATGEIYIALGSVMVFFLAGIGLFLLLVLTEIDRRKGL